LRVDNIQTLLESWKQSYPELEPEIRKLDPIAASVMARGLLSYGWTHRQLSECRGRIAMKLKQYIDFGLLAKGDSQMGEQNPMPSFGRSSYLAQVLNMQNPG
jgi:hypothetical protein